MKTIKSKVILLTVTVIVSECLLLYPCISDIYNSYAHSRMIAEYDETIETLEEDDLEEEYSRALEYNSRTAASNSAYSDYESLLNVGGNGVMGYISIPCINVSLPIYHYTTDEVLKKGIGHIETTSLPVGGESTHCVLSGHSGLPGSTLFTDLDQVEIGDMFYITVLGYTLAYEVTSVEVVEPSDLDTLNIVQGEDLVTLVTCTPYGINSHRLLVTGTRKETEESILYESIITWSKTSSRNRILPIVACTEALTYAAVMTVMIRRNKKHKRKARLIEDDFWLIE